MKLEDIIHVLCLSCVLMFFCVSSQSSCPAGWFGHQCKYKCHCENTSCNVDGSCIQPPRCTGGWFGPACQYADVAYRTVNLTEITDGNDTTCNVPNAGVTVTIPFSESVYFTWLRIHVTNQGRDAIRDMIVTFTFSTTPIPCPEWRKYAVNETILEMHCNMLQPIHEMTLVGQVVPHLCSVYVSGGRNVALKETAWQPGSYNLSGTLLTADKAVDGNTNWNLFRESCTHSGVPAIWNVTLSRQRCVHKYIIYNRGDDHGDRLKGFSLESFDSTNRSVFTYKDHNPQAQFVYKFSHSPTSVKMIFMTTNNSVGTLTLCEVEVYGDSICDQQHYGRDCEHSCRCAINETCFVTTGGCPSGCAAGFFGEGCARECPVGKFGVDCRQSCSTKCVPTGNASVSPCDRQTGLCNTGCNVGAFGLDCNKSCSANCVPSGRATVSSCNHQTGVCGNGCNVGAFGANCDQLCSPNCVPSGSASVSSCDQMTGVCVKGCIVGAFGMRCNQSCNANCMPSGKADVSSCDSRTGECSAGCQSGFSGSLCTKECDVGTFGVNCKESCSPNCAPPDKADVSSCDTKTGTCLKGCQSGSSGNLCKKAGPLDSANFLMEILLCVAGLLAVLFILIFCLMRKKPQSAAERKAVNDKQGEQLAT